MTTLTPDKSVPYEDFKRANTRDNCQLAIDGIVYDVTSFLGEHPGGQIVLLQNGGKDASRDFHTVRHSESALAMMAKYKVGKLTGLFNKSYQDEAKLQNKDEEIEELNKKKERRKRINDVVKGVTAVVLLVVLGVVGFRMFKKVPRVQVAQSK